MYLTLGAFALNFAACGKKNAELETDYASKKASAETLINQINTAKATMMTDHDNWMKAITDAWHKPGADTAKLNSLKSDLDKHMADGQAIGALEDSVKAYMNATPDQGDAFKNADDRLGTNYNDLNDKWKSFTDKHASLQKDITAAAVTTAGEAAKDTVKAAQAGKPAPKGEPKAAEPKKAAPHAEQKKETPKERHGAPMKSTD